MGVATNGRYQKDPNNMYCWWENDDQAFDVAVP